MTVTGQPLSLVLTVSGKPLPLVLRFAECSVEVRVMVTRNPRNFRPFSLVNQVSQARSTSAEHERSTSAEHERGARARSTSAEHER